MTTGGLREGFELPQIEDPNRFADTLGRFLDEMKPLGE